MIIDDQLKSAQRDVNMAMSAAVDAIVEYREFENVMAEFVKKYGKTAVRRIIKRIPDKEQ